MIRRKHCESCGQWYFQSQEEQAYCSARCRVAAKRFEKKMSAAGIATPDADELKRATAVVHMDVFKRDMSVIEAIEKGYIIIEYQPRLLK